jgi:uncharacterized RDD family membrane protein YckC
MRCPKCQYISFEDGDRCRNCGYEFALVTSDPAPIDVTIARDEPPSGRGRDAGLSALDAPISRDGSPEADGERRGRSGRADEARRPVTAADLPLFTERVADDQAPLVDPPAVPRPPLSVRRATPAPRARARPAGPDELPLGLAPNADEDADGAVLAHQAHRGAAAGEPAGVGRRIAAGVVDASIMGGIGAGVLYLTLRACELSFAQWRQLPLVPLAAFLLLLCGGYFVLFTAAGGQTIGKMISGIRVVFAPEGSAVASRRIPFNTAMMRAVAALGSLAALGIGFLPVLLRPDRRAFHDRVAETRVVVA